MGSMPQSSKLFEALKIGNVTLDHRIVMAPLTRFRNSDEHVILPMAQEYYEQRACVPGTLIISEASVISKRASGYANIPGIWNKEQITAWKAVVDRVHKSGSYIYLQLWALGRVADPTIKQKEGTGDVVSSSPTPYQEGAAIPRALTEEEIQQYIRDYASAAEAGVHEAGFDGVEIHAANGYLIDQFTQDTCNKRTDKWGGSIENRARFALEVTKAVVQAVGSEKTAIRLSPFSPFQGMKMEDPVPQFNYLVSKLKELKLSYLHLVESRITGNADVEATEKIDPFIQIYGNVSPVLLAGGFTPESAKRAVDEEYKDVDMGIVFGRYFIPNPDLVYRVKKGIELRMYERDTFYTPKQAKGYIDWPFRRSLLRRRGGRSRRLFRGDRSGRREGRRTRYQARLV
ncbi:Chanoclavine-I aldehyde reductase fgaOx3 [Pseudocercospora fuligena]|uniref:Chanoclavine-I aldehyde reductase fgaOx3 n=1 Tax=Pseudocercospora fuligena TaxID=685502 RepID=A0A8H6R4G0_9PEZI|nr:Chanoclavine-I aldehyde reductase fgaOx3 [Pseudocercospora fuligena]